MSEKCRKFLENCSKSCFVLLERLDRKILNQYLQEQELSLEVRVARENIPNHHNERKGGKAHFFEKYSKAREGNARESALKNGHVRRRKSRAKPLCYSDDEEDSAAANSKENVSGQSGSFTKSSECQNALTARLQDSEGNSGSKACASQKGNVKDSEGSHESDGGRNTSQKPMLKEKNDNLAVDKFKCLVRSAASANEESPQPSEELSQKQRRTCGGKMNSAYSNRCHSAIESEIEMIEGRPKLGKKNEEDKISEEPEAKFFLIPKEELESEESDSRDEGEDDRATIIFERSFGDITKDVEVFEIAEKISGNAKKKVKKRKITNRKKRKLIKFKRKRSMMGRNLAKVKKTSNKLSEGCDNGQQPSVNEGYLKDVCVLVKRLHELYSVISQLQKNLPKNPEVADHFIKTINVQKESFHKEIRRSHKILMEGYDSMLSSYGDSNKVSWEIGKRTSLSKEDVANVISKCSQKDGANEEKQRMKETEEEKSNPSFLQTSPKHFGVGSNVERVKNVTDDKMEAPLSAEKVPEANQVQCVLGEKGAKEGPQPGLRPNTLGDPIPEPPPPPPSNHSECRPTKPLQRPEPKMTKEVPSRENAWMAHAPSEHFRPFLHPSNTYQGEWADFSKPRSQFWPQKSYNHRTNGMFRDPRMRQFPQDPTRIMPRGVQVNHTRPFRAHNLSSNVRPHFRGGGFPVYIPRPRMAANYPPNINTGCYQVPGGFVPARAPSERGARPPVSLPSLMDIPIHPSGFNRERLPVNQCPQILNPGSSPAICPLPLVQNFDKSPYVAPSHPMKNKSPNALTKGSNISQRRDDFQKSFEYPPVRQAFPRKECPVEGPLTDFLGHVQPIAPDHLKSHMQTHGAVDGPHLIPEEMYRKTYSLSTDLTNESEKCESHVLDPTVPQKLTMRNCRLEAGPILEPKSESLKAEDSESTALWHRPLPEETPKDDVDDSEAGALHEKDSNSRVYMCAQNGCKKPGIRICKGCLSIIYCSEACQLEHWALKHRTECHQLKELRG